MYDRVINLIGPDNFDILSKKKILLVGVGGVGGFVFEALIRSGIKNITVYDGDTVEITNLNRQLVANLDTIGKYKSDIAVSKAKKINEDINVSGYNKFLDASNINDLDNDYDYIIDACDSINTKLELIRFAEDKNIKIISSMGVGNRVDASKLIITRLNKTSNDPLAKKLRKLVKDSNLNMNTLVLCSKEVPIKKGKVDSLITLPGVAGLLIANYVINDLINLY